MITEIGEPKRRASKHVSDEDLEMTIQVCLVATNGIVLASDLKHVFYNETWSGGLATKIVIDDLRGVAVAWSGYEISRVVAKEIISHVEILESKRPREALEALATEIYDKPFPDLIEPESRRSEVIVVSKSSLDKFYSMTMSPSRNQCYSLADKAVAGQRTSPAWYFIERYYNGKQTISDLLLVGAHAVLQASKLDPKGIQGLEIVTCTKEGIVPVPHKEIDELSARSDQLDAAIAESLFPPLPL
jgi:hypothetical protein